MTFDTHLINVALAGLGISAGIAILMAAASAQTSGDDP